MKYISSIIEIATRQAFNVLVQQGAAVACHLVSWMTCEFKWLGEARSNMTGSECLSLSLVSSRGPLTCAEYYLCDTVMCFPRVISIKVN